LFFGLFQLGQEFFGVAVVIGDNVRGVAALWVDVGSRSAKIGLVYWIRGKEDRGKRGRDRKKDVIVG
jgi:hypothetical protein